MNGPRPESRFLVCAVNGVAAPPQPAYRAGAVAVEPRTVVNNRFRRMQTTHRHTVAQALARRRAMLVVLSAEDVPALSLQRFLDKQSGRQLHQRDPPGPSG